jgi:hypothetical protein
MSHRQYSDNNDFDRERAREASRRAGEAFADIAGSFAEAFQQRSRNRGGLVPTDPNSPEQAVAKQEAEAKRAAVRASDADRQAAADVLNNAYAEGRLTISEHRERLDQVMSAKTLGELAPALADLNPPPGAVPSAAAWTGNSTAQVSLTGQPQQDLQLFGIFSGPNRSGAWLVPAKISTVNFMGGTELDFRDAVFTTMQVEVNAFCMMGGLDIRVPNGVGVIDNTHGFMGGTEAKNLAPAEPGAPVIVINGLAVMGAISIKGDRRNRRR